MNIKVNAELRNTPRKSDLKNLRNDGFIPGIIYGEGQEGVKISLPKATFLKEYKKSLREVAIFEIDVDGKKYTTFLKEKQIHPVTREFIHIDFMELHKGKEITLDVPLNYIGEAAGIKEGGLVDILCRSIEISCLPKDIPEEIDIDITNLKIGDTLHLSDISLPANIAANIAETTTLITVRAPKLAAEEEAEEAVEAVE